MAKRGGKRRDPSREKLWRRTIREQERSGLAVRAFCQSEGLKVCNFLWWRRELNRRDRQKTGFLPDSSTKELTERTAIPVFLSRPCRRLPSMPPGPLDGLLPDVWFVSHPSARRKTAA